MWYLNSENDKRVIYILPGKDITIGRSVDAEICNFAIPDDASISRKHVTISFTENNLYLEDLGSKYGTYINDSSAPIEHNKKIKLACNDKVVLGKMGSVWKVHQINMVTCSSTLKGDSLSSLRNNIFKLGGVLKSDWDDTCAYLTMPAITLTIKVVLALVQNSYIVNTEYWNKCVESVNSNAALPDPTKFVPQILEPSLNKEDVSFLPSKDRCSLFTGKRIIFFSRRQLEMYKPVLMKSSATALLLSETKLTKKSLLDSDVIVIQFNITSNTPDTQTQRDQMKEITDYLKSEGKRIVADAEIGLAILYCSLSKYCNPYFNFSSEVVKQTSQENKTGNQILAQETQEQSQVTVKKENVQIDESLSACDDSTNVSSKRKLSEDDITGSNKRLATSVSTSSFSDARKRPAEGDIKNPSKKMALDNEDDEGMFNFVESADSGSKTNESNKKLNFFKPQKRKLEARDNEEEGLFNFVEDSNSSDNDMSKKLKVDNDEKINITKKIEENVDISTLRGKKLQELIEYNSKMTYHKEIKKEDTSELDEKFSNIDLGSTVVVVKDLIVKKEPVAVPESTAQNGIKNFKKFKKVWPVRMQISIASDKPSTENVAIDEMNTVSVNC